MEDTPQFKELKDDGEVAEIPVKELFRNFKGSIFRIAGLSALYTGGYYVAYVYGPIYMQTVGHQTAQVAFTSTCIVLVLGAILNPVSGRLSDRFGRRPLFLAAGITGVVFAVPAFALMASSTSTIVVIAAQILLAIPVSLSIGPAFSAFAEMLTAQVRYSGIALGMNLAQLVLGGTAPVHLRLADPDHRHQPRPRRVLRPLRRHRPHRRAAAEGDRPHRTPRRLIKPHHHRGGWARAATCPCPARIRGRSSAARPPTASPVGREFDSHQMRRSTCRSAARSVRSPGSATHRSAGPMAG